MKSVLIGLMLTIGLSTFANTTESVYKKDSVLPSELKEKVIQFITEKCAQDISAYGLNEVETVVTSQSDPDVESQTNYETIFTSRYYFDGVHPSTQQIKITTSKNRSHTGSMYYQIHRLITQSGCEQ